MKILTAFGLLFFLLSIIFCAFQLITLSTTDHLRPGPLLLQFSISLVCLALGSLAAQTGQKSIPGAVSVVAFSMCFVALLAGGILALRGTGETAPLRFIIFLAYGGFYALFGLGFSFLAAKPAPTSIRQPA